MKKAICWMVAVTLIGLLAGCAATTTSTKKMENEALLPEIDVVQVKENSDEALKLAQEAKLDVDALNTKITDIDNKIIVLTEEISDVSTAKIEEMENRQALLVEAYKDLEARVHALQIAPASSRGKGEATFSPSSAAAILTNSAEYDTYQTGLKTFNSRNYQEATKVFTSMTQQYPSGRYIDNAYYWIGECNYAMNDFASAIAAYQKVLTFKSSTKADEAQMRVALSYMKLGKQDVAKEEMKKLIDRYPASELVPRAKKYLEGMK